MHSNEENIQNQVSVLSNDQICHILKQGIFAQ